MLETRLRLDFGDPLFIDDPWPVLAEIRKNRPLCAATVDGSPTWLLSRYRDVVSVLNDRASTVNEPGHRVPADLRDGAAALLWRTAVSRMDPPEHARIRRRVSRPFTRRRAEGLRTVVREIAGEVLETIVPGEPTDLVRRLSLPIPMKVLCRVLGVPEDDWGSLESWTNDFLTIFLPSAKTRDQFARIESASRQFVDYLDELIRSRRQNPAGDLISEFAADMDAKEGLSRDELIGAVRGLVTAGYETTAATISAACICFAERPDLIRRLRTDGESAAKAVEEILRWETPVQVSTRYLGRSVELYGRRLEAGTAIGLLLGAANRDPDVFPDPDRISLRRSGPDHLAFGGGRHFCFGAYLARVELQETLKAMASRWKRIELAPSAIERRRNFQFRTITHLPATPVA